MDSLCLHGMSLPFPFFPCLGKWQEQQGHHQPLRPQPREDHRSPVPGPGAHDSCTTFTQGSVWETWWPLQKTKKWKVELVHLSSDFFAFSWPSCWRLGKEREREREREKESSLWWTWRRGYCLDGMAVWVLPWFLSMARHFPTFLLLPGPHGPLVLFCVFHKAAWIIGCCFESCVFCKEANTPAFEMGSQREYLAKGCVQHTKKRTGKAQIHKP